jgi:hypothetical protein
VPVEEPSTASISEVGQGKRHVRFPPDSDRTADIAGGPVGARSDVFALQHTASLFVGTRARRILTVNHTELECAVLAAEPSEC